MSENFFFQGHGAVNLKYVRSIHIQELPDDDLAPTQKWQYHVECVHDEGTVTVAMHRGENALETAKATIRVILKYAEYDV